ncbi:MAG: amidohydrolase [Firmicutes bacterium]|nr:amidohydrolase [Bacillota bacterium]
MARADYPILDADGHVMDRPEHFEEFCEPGVVLPHVLIDQKTQTRYWLLDDGRLLSRPMGPNTGAGIGFIDHPDHPVLGRKLPAMRARDNGALDDIAGRLEDMDQEGIDLAVLYPTLMLGLPFFRDKDLAAALARGYNNYVANRLKGQEGRLRAAAVVPLQDPPAAIEELRRAKSLGFVAVMVTGVVGDGNNTKTLDQEEFFPFFQECDRLDMPVAVHSVAGAYSLPWADIFDRSFYYSHLVAHPFTQMIALATIIGGGLLERLPRIRFAILETGCGWVPHWLWWMDEHFEDDRYIKERAILFGRNEMPYLKKLPSEYVREGRIFFHAHEAEPELPRLLEMGLGGQLMYASDYPHEDAAFPESVNKLQARADLPEAVKRQILGENAMRFYGIAVTEKARPVAPVG